MNQMKWIVVDMIDAAMIKYHYVAISLQRNIVVQLGIYCVGLYCSTTKKIQKKSVCILFKI